MKQLIFVGLVLLAGVAGCGGGGSSSYETANKDIKAITARVRDRNVTYASIRDTRRQINDQKTRISRLPDTDVTPQQKRDLLRQLDDLDMDAKAIMDHLKKQEK
jgi:hypothetical protein